MMSVALLADEQVESRLARVAQDLWSGAVKVRHPVFKLLDWRASNEDTATHTNPFAVVVRAYRMAQDTRGAVEARGPARCVTPDCLAPRLYASPEGVVQPVEDTSHRQPLSPDVAVRAAAFFIGEGEQGLRAPQACVELPRL